MVLNFKLVKGVNDKLSHVSEFQRPQKADLIKLAQTIGTVKVIKLPDGISYAAIMVRVDKLKELGINLEEVFINCDKKNYYVKKGDRHITALSADQEAALWKAIIEKNQAIEKDLMMFNSMALQHIYEQGNFYEDTGILCVRSASVIGKNDGDEAGLVSLKQYQEDIKVIIKKKSILSKEAIYNHIPIRHLHYGYAVDHDSQFYDSGIGFMLGLKLSDKDE